MLRARLSSDDDAYQQAPTSDHHVTGNICHGRRRHRHLGATITQMRNCFIHYTDLAWRRSQSQTRNMLAIAASVTGGAAKRLRVALLFLSCDHFVNAGVIGQLLITFE